MLRASDLKSKLAGDCTDSCADAVSCLSDTPTSYSSPHSCYLDYEALSSCPLSSPSNGIEGSQHSSLLSLTPTTSYAYEDEYDIELPSPLIEVPFPLMYENIYRRAYFPNYSQSLSPSPSPSPSPENTIDVPAIPPQLPPPNPATGRGNSSIKGAAGQLAVTISSDNVHEEVSSIVVAITEPQESHPEEQQESDAKNATLFDDSAYGTTSQGPSPDKAPTLSKRNVTDPNPQLSDTFSIYSENSASFSVQNGELAQMERCNHPKESDAEEQQESDTEEPQKSDTENEQESDAKNEQESDAKNATLFDDSAYGTTSQGPSPDKACTLRKRNVTDLRVSDTFSIHSQTSTHNRRTSTYSKNSESSSVQDEEFAQMARCKCAIL